MGERDSWLYDAMRGRDEHSNFEPEKVHDLGSDVMIVFYTRGDSDERVGFMESHPTPEGVGCHGSVMFDVPANAEQTGAKWQLISLDPLHIEPSVLCNGCGHHGFVRDGRWVSC